MQKVNQRSAVALGLAAASAAVVKPAAAQTTAYQDMTPWPGVVVRAYDGETPSIIPGFKTVSMRDVIMQPGSKTMGPPMENAMVCHITEGELRVEQDGCPACSRSPDGLERVMTRDGTVGRSDGLITRAGSMSR
jgi:hypothetical protein